MHDDDDAEGGRISRLARDVKGQYEMLTGDILDLFLDRDELRWGDAWREVIDSELNAVAFFVPVLTPRYFMSPECRRELQIFASRSTQLSITELVLPLLYLDFDALKEVQRQDELIKLIQTFQWKDWRDLRFAAPTTEVYRRAVAELAVRLVIANRESETASAAEGLLATEDRDETTDSVPGTLDQLAEMEEALPELNNTLNEMTQNIELVGSLANSTTAALRKAETVGGSFRTRVVGIRRLAADLSGPADDMVELSNRFVSHLYSVDQGIRLIVTKAPDEIRNNPGSKSDMCGFFEKVRELSAMTHKGMDSTQRMIDNIAPIESLSRDLRPVLRRLRKGLSRIVEGGRISEEWISLIDKSGISCQD